MAVMLVKDDPINRAIVDGLTSGFRADMTKRLREVAEAEIEILVGELARRLEVAIKSHKRFDDFCTDIRLEVLFKREDSK